MKASEAKQITKETTLQDLLKEMKSSAESGQGCYWIPMFQYVKDETKWELVRLGYNLKTVTDYAGVESILITWI